MKKDYETIWKKSRLQQTVAYAALIAATLLFSGCGTGIPKTFEEVDSLPSIYPDYVGTTLPVNIAPANFRILEEGNAFAVCVTTGKGKTLKLAGPDIKFSERQWRKAIADSVGEKLSYDVFVKRDGKWMKFKTFENEVSPDPIDAWVAYRLIEPGYEFGHRICLAQRSLETFKEEVFADNRATSTSPCVNCHSFQDRKTDRFLFHFRQNGNDTIQGGTILVDGKKVRKVTGKFEAADASCSYPAWRPTGDLVAFSVNQTRQSFHSLSTQKIEVFDFASDLVLFDFVKNEIVPVLTTKDDFETFPSWSPDGKTLYYCCAHVEFNGPLGPEGDRSDEAGQRTDDFHYDIMKMDFDEATRTFGEPQLVVDAGSNDKSALFPRVSPDGNRLVYTLVKSGTFSIWRPEADLYIKDLRTGEERRWEEVDSNDTESYHTWSSSGKWMVFSSRREDGQYTRLYFTHIDENGRATKPFVLPQKDPRHNWNRFKSYNVPELIVEPIDVDQRAVVDAMNADSIPTTNR